MYMYIMYTYNMSFCVIKNTLRSRSIFKKVAKSILTVYIYIIICICIRGDRYIKCDRTAW